MVTEQLERLCFWLFLTVYVVITKVGVISLLSPSAPRRLEHNAEQICLKKERNTVAQYCFPADMYMLQTSLPIAKWKLLCDYI